MIAALRLSENQEGETVMPRISRTLVQGGLLLMLALVVRAAWADDPAPLRIHLIGVGEYKPAETLAEFKKHLEQHYRVECTASLGGNGKKLDNLDALKSADLLVISARRMNLPEEQ